jgi:methionine--tRNA ligase beta chain
MDTINYDDFKKVDLRIAKILKAERVEGSEKLVKLEVKAGDVGIDGAAKNRQIVAGIGTIYQPEILVGKSIIIVANLEPRKLMGHESQGMLLAASDEMGPVLVVPESEVPPGSGIK